MVVCGTMDTHVVSIISAVFRNLSVLTLTVVQIMCGSQLVVAMQKCVAAMSAVIGKQIAYIMHVCRAHIVLEYEIDGCDDVSFSDEQCCEEEAKCSSHTCPEEHVFKSKHLEQVGCHATSCTDQRCCEPEQDCVQHDCGAKTCKHDQCCAVEASCASHPCSVW